MHPKHVEPRIHKKNYPVASVGISLYFMRKMNGQATIKHSQDLHESAVFYHLPCVTGGAECDLPQLSDMPDIW
jgi:hypothetical protein